MKTIFSNLEGRGKYERCLATVQGENIGPDTAACNVINYHNKSGCRALFSVSPRVEEVKKKNPRPHPPPYMNENENWKTEKNWTTVPKKRNRSYSRSGENGRSIKVLRVEGIRIITIITTPTTKSLTNTFLCFRRLCRYALFLLYLMIRSIIVWITT